MQTEIRQIKYLNNIIEQDLCRIKHITNPTLGFKAFYLFYGCDIGGDRTIQDAKKGQHIDVANSPTFEQFYTLAA